MNNYFSSIEILNESNYCNWKQDLKFSLGIFDFDLALREGKPMINSESTPEQKKLLAKGERSNSLSLIAIRRTIFEHLLCGLPEKPIAKKFLDALEKRYQVFDNAEP